MVFQEEKIFKLSKIISTDTEGYEENPDWEQNISMCESSKNMSVTCIGNRGHQMYLVCGTEGDLCRQ